MKRPILFLAVLSFTLAAQGIHAYRSSLQQPQIATGYVFHDANNNGRRDSGERGLAGIKVSNQEDIVVTDRDGRYRLPVTDDTILFVVKPKGWRTPISEKMLPQFFYIHKPQGSRPVRYRGVPPTGPLPGSIDFPLYPQREPRVFKALMFGDTQPRNQQEVDWLAHDVIAEAIGTNASFGVTLGDIVFDNLDVFDGMINAIALIGIPWYNVLGNHDINLDSPDDQDSDETFHRHFGPNYYSFDYGSVHFMVLDDVNWTGQNYNGAFGPKQMRWIKNDLSMIPKNQLVVLMMHIPLVNVNDRQELYRIIEQRPFALSISAHTHYQEHRFITKEDGWQGIEPHHHIINVTTCGSWWSGVPDENGIPHTTMRDGAPNGYAIMTFDGTKYDWEFKAARRPKSHQMNIWMPETVASTETANTEVVANVFGGSIKSKVEMSVDNGNTWTPMEKKDMEDPFYKAMKAIEEGPIPPPGRKLPAIIKSPHIWAARLPANMSPGIKRIRVRTTDMFGKKYEDHRSIRITR
ncbi:MAG: calcineurin-like phosphoesterase C-terminal domain-containing protein [Armatimonadetes bacterium]|nr:calcineurin-like phosphoesterase C-terminal domain-containing protein [Armatimonadota bacterium]